MELFIIIIAIFFGTAILSGLYKGSRQAAWYIGLTKEEERRRRGET
jgi:hypothetical protein